MKKHPHEYVHIVSLLIGGFFCIAIFYYQLQSYLLQLRMDFLDTQVQQVIHSTTWYDFVSDDSITKYVDNKIPFSEVSYIPENLVGLKGEYLIDTKRNSTLRQIALTNLVALSGDFYKEFWVKIPVVSAYRSYTYQQGIKARGCPDNLCAKAGYSEHQSGLVVDLWETTTNEAFMSQSHLRKYYDWLDKNAYKYGYTNTYQNGVEVDGYEIEPWHWRYVWVKLARHLRESSITFAEYYYSKTQ